MPSWVSVLQSVSSASLELWIAVCFFFLRERYMPKCQCDCERGQSVCVSSCCVLWCCSSAISWSFFPVSFVLTWAFALLSCYQDCADIIWKILCESAMEKSSRANVSGDIMHSLLSVASIQQNTWTCNRPPLGHMESQTRVLVPSHPRPWGGCGPCGRPRVHGESVSGSASQSRPVGWLAVAAVAAVAAWRQRSGPGSKCDCSTVLVDLAVKWDWRPSYLSDWLTDCLTHSYWEYLTFKRVIHAGTDLKGTECLGVRYVNKSGDYFLFVNVCWNCSVQLLFWQRTPCTWTVYTLCLVYLVST